MRVLERVTGYALFDFTRTPVPVLPSEATLELIGRILGFGQSHCRLFDGSRDGLGERFRVA